MIRQCHCDVEWYHEPAPWSEALALIEDADGNASWSCLVFLDRDDDRYFNERLSSGLYSARFGRRTANLRDRVGDFLRYEKQWGRRVIVASEVAMDIVAYVSAALAATPPPSRHRPYDPSVLVHSTTPERWRLISHDGELLSSATLQVRGVEIPTIGFAAFGEPPEYAQFIYFSALGSSNGELVVLSHERGAVTTDFDAAYVPGARLYLDADSMVRDGLCIRDGLHALKVYRSMPLQRYLIDVVLPLQLAKAEETWTPRRFAALADKEFRRRNLAYSMTRPA